MKKFQEHPAFVSTYINPPFTEDENLEDLEIQKESDPIENIRKILNREIYDYSDDPRTWIK